MREEVSNSKQFLNLDSALFDHSDSEVEQIGQEGAEECNGGVSLHGNTAPIERLSRKYQDPQETPNSNCTQPDGESYHTNLVESPKSD